MKPESLKKYWQFLRFNMGLPPLTIKGRQFYMLAHVLRDRGFPARIFDENGVIETL